MDVVRIEWRRSPSWVKNACKVAALRPAEHHTIAPVLWSTTEGSDATAVRPGCASTLARTEAVPPHHGAGTSAARPSSGWREASCGAPPSQEELSRPRIARSRCEPPVTPAGMGLGCRAWASRRSASSSERLGVAR